MMKLRRCAILANGKLFLRRIDSFTLGLNKDGGIVATHH